tara:strand:+ start:918 stop:1169 length:252 start_codon:yes stop_codon:yes gene_type:complete
LKLTKDNNMYYATKAKANIGVWWMSKTLKGFLRNFKEEDQFLVCKAKPSEAMYGYYYKIVDGKIKRHPNKAVNVMWLAREVGL